MFSKTVWHQCIVFGINVDMNNNKLCAHGDNEEAMKHVKLGKEIVCERTLENSV